MAMSRNITDEDILNDLAEDKARVMACRERELQSVAQCRDNLAKLEERVEYWEREIAKFDRLIGLFSDDEQG